MAAVDGELTIFGAGTYRILEFEYEMHVETDSLGRPSSRIRGGQLVITIVSPQHDDPCLYEWFNTYMAKNGVIQLYSGGSKWRCSVFPEDKSYWFDHAYCISIREYFNCSSTGQMCMKLTLQPGIFIPASMRGTNETLNLKFLPTREDIRENQQLQDDNVGRIQSIHKDKF